MKFRKGDRVSITGTVMFDQHDGDHVHIDLDGDRVSRPVLEASRVKLVQAAFNLGDRVMAMTGDCAGEHGSIIGIHGDDKVEQMLWIKLDAGALITSGAMETQRLDPVPDAPAIPRYDNPDGPGAA